MDPQLTPSNAARSPYDDVTSSSDRTLHRFPSLPGHQQNLSPDATPLLIIRKRGGTHVLPRVLLLRP